MIDSSGVKFWDGTAWVTTAKGPKGLVGPKGPAGPTLAPVVGYANRNLTVIGSPTSTPTNVPFEFSDLSARSGEVNSPIVPESGGLWGWGFTNPNPWCYWIHVFFDPGVIITQNSHLQITRINNSDGGGAREDLVRKVAALNETTWGVSGIFPKMAGPDKLSINGFTFTSTPNYTAWMTVTPIGPIYQ